MKGIITSCCWFCAKLNLIFAQGVVVRGMFSLEVAYVTRLSEK